MDVTYVDVEGLVVPASALEGQRAKSLAEAVADGRMAYVRLVECRKVCAPGGGAQQEAVIIDVEVERPQHTKHPIRRIERIACLFLVADQWYPDVLALRRDFPRVPHTNLRDVEIPRCLCLYDRPWSEVVIRWTPASFVNRIRYWLAESAKGTLHQADQPLEPLLLGSGIQIILPPDLFASGTPEMPLRLDIQTLSIENGRGVLVGFHPDPEKAQEKKFEAVALCLAAPPQQHGTISHTPQTLHDLDEFTRRAGLDLLAELRRVLPEWNKPEFLGKVLVLVIAFPLRRQAGAAVEAQNLWVFQTLNKVKEVGVDIGVWGTHEHNGKMGLIFGSDASRTGAESKLLALAPIFDLDRERAAAASGITPDTKKIVAVGAGALGSQIVSTLARSGFGRWTVVDEDHLLPHNLARHSLDHTGIGQSKALCLAYHVSNLYDQGEPAKWIAADVLRPVDNAEQLADAYKQADVILDMAASVPVSRHIAREVDSPARRAGAFLNPSGTDLVVLAEGADRAVTLDCLEMQYYRAVATIPDYAFHLAPPTGRLRYSRSCRDVSSTIPNHLVTMHGAIGAGAVRLVCAAPDPVIRIWQANRQTFAVSERTIAVTGMESFAANGWTLVIDRAVLAEMREARGRKLPCETGGVLLGAYDLARRVLYVVMNLPSPADSEEWPTLYIRGSRGLAAQVEEIGRRTDGQLEYVGEWHSHPDGCPCLPSGDDLKVFAWLTERMSVVGLPALMTIAGQGGVSAWYVGEMKAAPAWEVTA